MIYFDVDYLLINSWKSDDKQFNKNKQNDQLPLT